MRARILPALFAALAIAGSLACCVPLPAVQPTPAQGLIIRTGTYFGTCLGYCRETLSITPEVAVLTKSSNNPDDRSHPDISVELSGSAVEWDGLVALFDVDEFDALPEVIGCPDCADGGAEWIEVSTGNTTERVEFEYGASIPEIEYLLPQLRELRETLSSTIALPPSWRKRREQPSRQKRPLLDWDSRLSCRRPQGHGLDPAHADVPELAIRPGPPDS